jgi:Protein of unknown function (DUF3455)
MKNSYAQAHQTTHRLRLMACVAALAGVFTAMQPQPTYADDGLVTPHVPNELEVPSGNKAFLKGHAIGTQNYICLPSASGVSWTLFGPQATLFNNHDVQIITHFLSPNRDESDTPRPTWQHSRDTSTVWARAQREFPVGGTIPWLLLEVVGAEPGPTGGNRLTRTTFIQRLNTSGGLAPEPSDGCSLSMDAGKRAFVPYEADYIFYKAVTRK